MRNVIDLASYQYLKERSDAVLLTWHEGIEGAEGWLKLTDTKDLAVTVLSMLEATPACQIGIAEVGRMTPDMSIEDFYETLAEMADEVGANPGWLKINRQTAAAVVAHLVDIRENPIHLTDFEPVS